MSFFSHSFSSKSSIAVMGLNMASGGKDRRICMPMQYNVKCTSSQPYDNMDNMAGYWSVSQCGFEWCPPPQHPCSISKVVLIVFFPFFLVGRDALVIRGINYRLSPAMYGAKSYCLNK